MAKQLIKNPLTNDKEESEEFIRFILRKAFLCSKFFLYDLLQPSRNNKAAIVKETIDIEKFMEKWIRILRNFEKFSLEWKNKTIIQFQFRIWLPFYPQYQSNELSGKIRKALHEDVGGYMTMLETQPFINFKV